jgi:hypothetical protein
MDRRVKPGDDDKKRERGFTFYFATSFSPSETSTFSGWIS